MTKLPEFRRKQSTKLLIFKTLKQIENKAGFEKVKSKDSKPKIDC